MARAKPSTLWPFGPGPYLVSPRRGGKFGIPSDAYAVTFGGVGLGLTLASSPSTGFSLAA